MQRKMIPVAYLVNFICTKLRQVFDSHPSSLGINNNVSAFARH